MISYNDDDRLPLVTTAVITIGVTLGIATFWLIAYLCYM